MFAFFFLLAVLKSGAIIDVYFGVPILYTFFREVSSRLCPLQIVLNSKARAKLSDPLPMGR
jgi:hypothetical protein